MTEAAVVAPFAHRAGRIPALHEVRSLPPLRARPSHSSAHSSMRSYHTSEPACDPDTRHDEWGTYADEVPINDKRRRGAAVNHPNHIVVRAGPRVLAVLPARDDSGARIMDEVVPWRFHHGCLEIGVSIDNLHRRNDWRRMCGEQRGAQQRRDGAPAKGREGPPHPHG